LLAARNRRRALLLAAFGAGRPVVLDDYGFALHHEQKQCFDELAKEWNVEILPCPRARESFLNPDLHSVSVPSLRCTVCGSTAFESEALLWPLLIEQWGLNETETAYVNRQQGTRCKRCGCNLRSLALARAILSACNAGGTFRRFLVTPAAWRRRTLGVDEAGPLSRWLRWLPPPHAGGLSRDRHAAAPYADQSFHLVLHSDTLEHVPDPRLGLAECFRVLKPGGWCCFTVPIITGRLTRSRLGMSDSFHGNPAVDDAAFRVSAEYGADVLGAGASRWFRRMPIGDRRVPFGPSNRRPSPMLINDGERMLPDSSDGNTFWEHVQRYRFAAGYAAGQRVLDIACGEGYGTAALHDAGAASIGVDRPRRRAPTPVHVTASMPVLAMQPPSPWETVKSIS